MDISVGMFTPHIPEVDHHIDPQQTIVTQVGVTEYETTKLPDQTKTAETVVYTTLTSECPYTTTVTEQGQVVTKTLTSTNTIVTQVDKTYSQTVYTTSATTEYETTDVYVTESCPVTSYTTVIEGSTTVVEQTNTHSVTVTKIYTTTAVYPVTMTKNIDTTVEVTVGQGQTVSQYTTYVVTQNGTFYTTKSLVPVTTVIPATRTTTAGTTATTAPVVAGANTKSGPAAALLAGIVGLVALV